VQQAVEIGAPVIGAHHAEDMGVELPFGAHRHREQLVQLGVQLVRVGPDDRHHQPLAPAEVIADRSDVGPGALGNLGDGDFEVVMLDHQFARRFDDPRPGLVGRAPGLTNLEAGHVPVSSLCSPNLGVGESSAKS
jgi:hypothetical protein